MGDTEGAASEQDDVSFLRTDDMVCLQSTATGSRICLAAEGFGNRHCYLENIADKNCPPHMTSCVFVIEQALSVRALQEMITAEAILSQSGQEESGSSKGSSGGGGGSKTLLYGHAVLLRHGHSKMYLACLSSTGSSSDKLAFDVGLQEHSKGEACWWTVHPASKQRSEGEKVRVGDEIILVSVATERYLHTAKEGDKSIVDASFKLTHWSVAPFGTGASRTKNMGFVFGGDVLRFFHGGDECLTVPSNWNDQNNMVIYEGGAVLSQARSLWRLDLIRTKWAGGFINWGYPVRITHITSGRYLGINESDNSICLVSREDATVPMTAFCVRADKDDKKIEIDEKEEEVIGSPLIKYGDTPIIIQHLETGFWLSYRSYETKKRGVGRVEEKQAIISEEGKMDDWLEFSRSQEEEAKTARVIRKCGVIFNHFIHILDSVQRRSKNRSRRDASGGGSGSNVQSPPGSRLGSGSNLNIPGTQQQQQQPEALLPVPDQEEMVMCLEDLIAYFCQPEEGIDHEEKQNKLKALRNRQDLFQEEGILNLILDAIDKINVVTSQGLLSILLGSESSSNWDAISASFYSLLASVIKGNHTNCAEFAQVQRLDWLFSRLSSQAAGEGSGMLDVLGCVLTDSPEALNMMKENHIKVIISLLEKHGRDPKVLDVLCSLCVGNGVAVRSSQNNICDNLLPGRNLLLQTKLVDHVSSMRPNIYVGKVEKSAMYRRWYFELTIDHMERLSHMDPSFRVGWANTSGYVPYPGGGMKWGGNGVGDDLFSYGFDGCFLWTNGQCNQVRSYPDPPERTQMFESTGQMLNQLPFLNKNDVIGCILDLNIPLITFTVNGMPVRGCFKNFNTDGMFYPVVSFSAKLSCRFLFGGDHGRLKYGPPVGHSPLVETLLPGQELNVEPCFAFGELVKSTILGPSLEATQDAAFVPHPVDTSQVMLPSYVEQIRDKLAENIHEVWATNKIEAGWTYAEMRDDMNYLHPCLTTFEHLPISEKRYDIQLALATLKTILALGYRITVDKPPSRIKQIRLPNDPFLQSNGYKPAPLDLSGIELTTKLEELIELLAENTHNVWSSERINQGWTYGVSEDPLNRRSPHLVPYLYVDDLIKKANMDTAADTVRTLLAYGYLLDAPTGDSTSFDELLGRTKSHRYDFRSYRAEKTYAVNSDKWYFEVEILTNGPVKVGWATLDFSPSCELGMDEFSYSFDTSNLKKCNSGNCESFGKQINVGDIVGCLLDLHDRTVSFSLNGELLLDASGNEMAFNEIVESDYVPAMTLGSGQKVRLIFGQDVNSLKCFTTCGLQEGYQPFCVNMNKNMTFWYNKDEPLFINMDESVAPLDVNRIPAGPDTPPALKVSHKLFDTQDKVSWEFLRLSLPVIVNDELINEDEKVARFEEMKSKQRRLQAEKQRRGSSVRHPAKLEEHMLSSGFSMADVQELSHAYEMHADDGETPMSPTPGLVMGSPWSRGGKQGSLTKTKSFDQSLTVPSLHEAQKIMKSTGGGLGTAVGVALPTSLKKATSIEALDGSSTPNEAAMARRRSKSPFRLFGKKDPEPPKKSNRSQNVEPQTVSMLAASGGQLIAPAVPDRPNQLRVPGPGPERRPSTGGSRRPSFSATAEGMVDETSEQLDPSCLELIDEYFYGVRIFPGQDPSHVYCGWVVSSFRHYQPTFDSSSVRKVTLQVWAEDGHLADYCDRQNSYMMNAGQLYSDVNESEGSKSNQGMYVGCHIDAATGIVTFTADGKATKHKFKVEPGTKLFPAVFFEATTSEPLQFELGRTPTTLPLSSAILRSSPKHLTPQMPPRLKCQSLTAYSWARVSNMSLKPHALKLSDIRGWSMIVDDPVSMLAVHIPEEDRCLDILELIEYEKLLLFHAQTLVLYGALCFQSNTRAAHTISFHVDEKQLMYAIQSQYMSGPLRHGFADLLIALHLQTFAYSRGLTQNEFIVPLGDDLKAAYTDNENLFNSITTLECYSIRPEMKQSEKVEKIETVKDLSSPYFDVDSLKLFVFEALDDAVKKLNRPMRDPIGGTNVAMFVPLIKLADKLLLIGCINDEDLNWVLRLLDPETFDPNFDHESGLDKARGLMQMTLDEGVKLEMCYLMHHLFDLQLRHRVESVISFSDDYVGGIQDDQLKRYMGVKQQELPAAVAAKKTKEFRCRALEQMRMMLGFKAASPEDGTEDICTVSSEMREPLENFHGSLMSKAKVATEEGGEGGETSEASSESGYSSSSDLSGEPKAGWSSKLMGIIAKVKSAGKEDSAAAPVEAGASPEDTYHKNVISLIGKWAEESEIENRELVRQMFALLLRCYNGVGELIEALDQTYVVSSTCKDDVIDMFVHLSVVRSLLPVQMSPEEEEIMRETLWTLAMNRTFFQHPDLIRILRIHENVMDVMTMTLSKRSSESPSSGGEPTTPGGVQQPSSSSAAIGDTSAMVVACCKFLCYFCRSSKANQKAMFGHLDFLLENSNILLSRPSLQGSTPLAVAESSVMESPELALALRENYLEKIAVYLSKCGFQSNQDLLDKGYPDIGWDPVEGSQYLGFFKTCVWVNGESVEENANLVIRLLIRRPECLGPALRGEGEGLLQAIKDAITMSENIEMEREELVNRGEPDPKENEDYIDMGTAILNFYCTLVDVLGRCAPDPSTIAQGKNDCIRTRAILRSLVPMADLEGVLSLRFSLRATSDNESDVPFNFIPMHKQAMVLFLDRVYGIESQEEFFKLLEEAFLPDLRAATVLERHDGSESEMALALNRYIGNFVLPLLIKYSSFFGNADNWSSLMDATLHTCYRMSKVKILTKGQRDCVSDFLVALTREMNPSMLLGLLRKLTVDVSVLTEYSTVALRLLTLHYERCNKYYGQGGQGSYGSASEEERRLTMLLFSNIFDSLAKMEYDPDLFSKALPCLTAIACALPPDYSLTTGADDQLVKSGPSDGPYMPNPVDTSNVQFNTSLLNIIQKYSEHYHDAWASRKFDHGWVYGDQWSWTDKTHPRIKPYHMLTEYERNRYKEPIADAIRSLLALGWNLEQSDASQAHSASRSKTSGQGIHDYEPQPVDMSSLTLSKELMAMAERLSENAHEVWASVTIGMPGGNLHPQMVPYDLLTDKEKKRNRFRCQELLKFLQNEGFRVYKPDDSMNRRVAMDETGPGAGTGTSTRFASSLLEKLNQYLDTASISLKLLKPSAVFSRRNSYRETSRDIKFFSKVVLPLVEKLFVAHRNFFLTSATVTAGAPQAGVATPREKEMVASLFCKLAALLRSKLSVMTHDAKISVRCLQTLIRATDARTIVRNSPDFVKTVLLTYFNQASDDLANCVINLQKQNFPAIRGTTMKTSTSLNYIYLVLIPTLTSVFDHLASNSFGSDLILNDIQVACYKILASLYTLGTNNTLHSGRKFIKTELEYHRPAVGNCLGAFAATFPVAFLEPTFNKSNKNCVHSRANEVSIDAQSIMQDLEASMPNIDDLMASVEKYVESEAKYAKEPHIIDILFPMLCAYLPFWWSQGADGSVNTGCTNITSEHLNRMLKIVFNLIKSTVSHANNNWMITLASHAGMIVINSSESLLSEVVYPLAEKLRNVTERTYHKEEITRSFLKGSGETSDLETALQEDYAILVRDIYAFYPLLIKYVDIMRSTWLKHNVKEAEQVYHCVAGIFNVWSKSGYMRKEEQNFISANEIDNMALIMPLSGKVGRPVMKADGHGSVGGKVKKKKGRHGPRNKDKELASSLMVSALKRLLPVGLNLFAGREQELVQYAKDKFLKKENETEIFRYVRNQLNLPDKIDPTDTMSWQHYLYSKLGKKEGEAVEGAGKEVAIVQQQQHAVEIHLTPEQKEKLQEQLVARIIDMAKVLFGLHVIDHPSQKEKGIFHSIVSASRKRAVIACFRMVSFHSLPRHRAMNIFLKTYNEIWLTEENVGQEQLVESLTQSFEDSEKSKGVEEEGEAKPDPITQMVTTLSRKAQSSASVLEEDKLYMEYANLFSQSCGGAEEDEGGDGGEEGEEPSIHEQELEKQRTLFHQMRLVERGTAEMVLLYMAASKGVQSQMVLKTLKLGISILRGGNVTCQQRMIQHLKDKRDVSFFTSIAGLMNSLTVLDLDAFERNQKAEGLGVGAEGTAGEQNMHDEEFSCALFRFIQLLCEGHNLDFQNYLRTQAGNTTTVNVIINTVDYLLRLQESMMDFYWHYSSKDIIDPAGKENYCKAINVAKQVFSTLTESIQGPCQGNQQALAHSRLWDAVGGFLFLFAHMQEKLSKNSSQLDLLVELLDLQKEMVVMMLSMLEGNIVNGTIGRQMVDTLVESAANVELILKFFDMFLKLPEQTASAAFQEIDKKSIGWVTVKDFRKALESQKVYSAEEIDYLMNCIEPTHDGLLDYREFSDRFTEPAKEIGFNLAVLLTNLSEHMPNDPRLSRFLEIASSILGYFEPFLGRIEIMGSAKHVERVYFEIKESSIAQWEKPQIKESKRAFFYFIVTEGGDKEKLEYFVDFCEDAIFEMQHAANIAMEVEEEAPKSTEYPFLGEEEKPPSALDPIYKLIKWLWMKLSKIFYYLTPSNIKTQIKIMKSKSSSELLMGLLHFIMDSFVFSGSFTWNCTTTFCKFILRLMTGEPIIGVEIESEEDEEAQSKALALVNPFTLPESSLPAPLPAPLVAIEAAPAPTAAELAAAEEAAAKEAAIQAAKEAAAAKAAEAEGGAHASTEGVEGAVTTAEPGAAAPATGPSVGEPSTTVAQVEPKKEEEKKEEKKEDGDGGGGEPGAAGAGIVLEEPDVPKETQPSILSSINFGNYIHRFVCFLARNFYNLKYVALFVAFMINFILLFYRVSVIDDEDDDGSGSGSILDMLSGSGSGSGDDDGSGEDGSDEMTSGSAEDLDGDGDPDEWIHIDEKYYYMNPMIRGLAIIHAILSFCMLVGYYHLKLPLGIFKREKEIARQMEFEGLFISEQPADNDVKGHWDKLVISTPSFPLNYWDKFAKKKVRDKYTEQYGYEQISALLGMDKGLPEGGAPGGPFSFITGIDWKYQIWKVGVTITDNSFLYNLWYFSFSVLGNFNYFFFCAHLLDIAVAIASLRTILQSVTHNGKQLVLTVLLLTIIVYIYTVIAFNFFRKFYVQEGDGDDDEDAEPVRKCHNMLTCFVFNVYQGVRSGGGIGDVIESADGDEYEIYRIIFDITFFFFIIIILLAILQGLIIDAFGELRSQLQSVVDDMEAACFICGIGKDYFDKVPHGFETHVQKEHNLANYLFFLMHLINKPDTDYTGQETYVWEMYQQRCWDFFPVGECFQKQYESELG